MYSDYFFFGNFIEQEENNTHRHTQQKINNLNHYFAQHESNLTLVFIVLLIFTFTSSSSIHFQVLEYIIPFLLTP